VPLRAGPIGIEGVEEFGLGSGRSLAPGTGQSLAGLLAHRHPVGEVEAVAEFYERCFLTPYHSRQVDLDHLDESPLNRPLSPTVSSIVVN
jgi:hypothetical protein